MRPIVKKAHLVMLRIEAERMFMALQPEWTEHLAKIEVPRQMLSLSVGQDWNLAREAYAQELSKYWGTQC